MMGQRSPSAGSVISRRLYYRTVTPFLILFFAIVLRIPSRWNQLLAPIVGKVLLFRKRRTVIANMQKVLGTSVGDRSHANQLWQKHVARLGLTILETIQLSRLPVDELQRRVLLRGEEHLRTALRSGRGLVLFAHHVGNVALVAVALGIRGYRTCIASNTMPITFIDERIDELHARCGASRVALGQDILASAKTMLRNNGVFAAIIDYSVKGKHTKWMEFGNAELRVSMVPAIIALHNEASILIADVTSLGINSYEVSVQPLPPWSTTGDVYEQAVDILRGAIKHVGSELQHRPDQWWRWDYPRIRLPESRTPGN